MGDPTLVVRETLRLLGATLAAEVEIETHLPPGLPQVNLDPIQVEQILVNLCINARDAMSGSGRLKIGLSRERLGGTVCSSCRQKVRGDYLVLRVKDTGCGIDPIHLDRLFEPFFRTKPSGQGSGMGLAVVHGIVHEYGGHLCVESTPGEGTLFRVLFPPISQVDRRVPDALEHSLAQDRLDLAGAQLRQAALGLFGPQCIDLGPGRIQARQQRVHDQGAFFDGQRDRLFN
jgi:signal transduction histidine kinase